MPSIAIIGAGPAGLTLARLLLVNAREHKINDLKISIFEHDASAKARWAQGGTLDLHPDTGIAALKAAQMWDDILPHMRYEGEELTFADKNATTLLHISSTADVSIPGTEERPEVDREVLKDYLLKAVEDISGPEAVTWGKHLVDGNATNGMLTFKDGTEAGPFDLVVGADGAWSKVRNVLTDVKPTYSGICGFECWIDQEHSGAQWEKFVKFVGKGSYFSYSDNKAFMVQRMEDGSMKAAVWNAREDTWPADVVKQTGGEEDKIRKVLLETLSDWDDQFLQILRTSWHFRPWPLWELPIGHSWEHKKGWTLIGDSAHLMTPFAGEGVNAAMKDSLELAKAITSALKGEVDLDDAIRNFEKEMTPRNTKVQQETARNKNGMFRMDAPLSFMADIGKIAAFEMGYDPEKGWISWVLPMVRILAYSYFWTKITIGKAQRWQRGT